MALIIVISTGDFQTHWNVLSWSFSERESGRWPLGLSDFYHNYLISNDWKDIHLQHLIKTIFIQQHDLLCPGGGTLNVEVIGMLVGNFFWKTLKNTHMLILNP